MPKLRAVPSKRPDVPTQHRQVAALVHRRGISGPEILLITSRDTGRWVIPKGWRQKGRSRSRSALREAFEEAGIRGTVRKKAVGTYVYEKRIDKKGVTRDCLVDVFLVTFSKQEKKWPERGQRRSTWLKPGVAARKVAEPELKILLRSRSMFEAAGTK